MLFTKDQHMIQALAAKRPDQAFNYGFCQGDRGDIGRSRILIARTRRLKACP